MDEYEMQGLRPGFVNRSTYESGIQTGIIQQFDLGSIQQINRLYNLQDKYTRYNENMLNAVMLRKFPETTPGIKANWLSMAWG